MSRNEIKDRPHVLLICTDHWPASLLGCAGHSAIRTPTLDQLAANGVRFTNAYSECPVCVPARRTLMTGLSPHSHGTLTNTGLAMPEVPTLAQVFSEAGYQTNAVGKLHVRPQRQRLGFDEVILDEEGRDGEGLKADDYELYLGDQGFPGERFAGGMSNNEYVWRPWHLDERHHVTNWATRMMCRQIIRRDPLRPGFWYLSYSHPHPPLAPLQAYLEMYRDSDIPDPVVGDWAKETHAPAIQQMLQAMANVNRGFPPDEIRAIRRAFYALCTHIDHQLRVVIGTLRQEGLLADTIIAFTSDHGDMLGDHGLWAKTRMYEGSANVPLIVSGTQANQKDGKIGHHQVDTRLAGLRDVMPTLLDLAGIPVPSHCEGQSLVSEPPRKLTYSAFGAHTGQSSENPVRMVRDSRYKLIYYPMGNLKQLFDLQEDPCELKDIARMAENAEILGRLSGAVLDSLTDGERQAWAPQGVLAGFSPQGPASSRPNPNYSGQRGLQWPNV